MTIDDCIRPHLYLFTAVCKCNKDRSFKSIEANRDLIDSSPVGCDW